MTLEKLKSYRRICAELENVEEELKFCEVADCVQSASTPPYSKHSVPVSGLPSTERVRALLDKQEALRGRKVAVERFVDSITDSEIRQIILIRYIRGKRSKSWQYIAMQIGYCSEHTPKRKLQKYFSNGGNGGF